MKDMKRYSVLVMNPANGSTDYVEIDSILDLGGYYSDMAGAVRAYNCNCVSAIAWDRRDREMVCLTNIEW